MPTGTTIVTNALTALGINPAGGTPSTSDLNVGLNELNDLWQNWGADEGMVYAVVTLRALIAAGLQYYTLGLQQGDFVTDVLPSRVYGAHYVISIGGGPSAQIISNGGSNYAVGDTGVILGAVGSYTYYQVATQSGGVATNLITTTYGTGLLPGRDYQTMATGTQPGSGSGLLINVQSVTATTQQRIPLRLVPHDVYYAHRDLSTTGTPEEVYAELALDENGYVRVYVWPIPNSLAGPSNALELEVGCPFTTWSLTANYQIPQSYSDPLKWALAFRLLSYFGEAVSPDIAQVVTENAEKSELRVRRQNQFNRQLLEGAEMLQPPQQQAPVRGQ